LAFVYNQKSFKLNLGYDQVGSYTGKGVRVHVLDTGVNLGHEEFEGRAMLYHVDRGLKDDCPDNLDCHSHGIS
jgi:subtilisin family serine protease